MIWLPALLLGASGIALHYWRANFLGAMVFGTLGTIRTILRPWRWARLIREKCDIADDESLRAGLEYWWGWKKEEWREIREARRRKDR